MNLWNRFSTAAALKLFIALQAAAPLQAQLRRKAVPLASCAAQVKQGVSGLIFEVYGNQMPAPGKGVPVRKGVQREFGIFGPARLTEAKKGSADGFFLSPGTPLLKKARSQKDGCFLLPLKPGKYSMLIREKGQWYANSFGGDGEIFQFEVFPDSVTSLDFRINHGAWY